VLKRLRIAFLLYVLAFVAAAQFFMTARTKDWDAPLWVDVYTVAGDTTPTTRDYLASLGPGEFDAVAEFFAREARSHDVALTEPFRVRVIGQLTEPLPPLAERPGPLDVLVWSLRMRWLAAKLRAGQDGPAGDILVLAVFHEPDAGVALDRSTALTKGLIAVANLFADRGAQATNQIVLAHELLHTLGATDKYSPLDNRPQFPDGYAAPAAEPLYPQTRAELMAGRVPLTDTVAEMPPSLREVVIGSLTATEIGW
jgi:hypothetical protein